ncbi:MAG: sulfur carrier protein ThiS [Myxococcota bacterium]
MQIVLNGEPRDVSDSTTVRALLCELHLDKSAIAVAVNRTFVPRSEHVTHRLAAGDEVELLAPMQGG